VLKRITAPALAAIVIGLSVPAHAGDITLVGPNFDVVYDPSSLGEFNAPMLIGNVLFFTPNNFTDQSLNGEGPEINNSVATGLELIADPGFQFNMLQVAAQGDYLMTGASSSVNVTGYLMATNPAQTLTQTTAQLVLNPSLPLNLDDGQTHNWAGTSTINAATPTDAPGYNPWLPGAQTVDLELSNTLYADTTSGSGPQQAFIQEKFAGLQLYIDPTPVPLPAPLLLLLTPLALVAGWTVRPVRYRASSLADRR
jgi:hypothetical protein